MYNAFFGFSESPFSLSPDPAFFYRSERHEEALANLLRESGDADAASALCRDGPAFGDLDPQQFAAFVSAEFKRWAPIVRASGAQAD